MKPRNHGGKRQPEKIRNAFAGPVLSVSQLDGLAILLGESRKRSAQGGDQLRLERWRVAVIRRLNPLPGQLIQRHHFARALAQTAAAVVMRDDSHP